MFGNDTYTVHHLDGRTGPTWTCDDIEEATALAEEHGYVLLYTSSQDDEATKLVVA